MDFALWHFRCLFHNRVLEIWVVPTSTWARPFFQLATESQERYCGWWKKSTSWLSLHIYINRICVHILLYTYEIEYWCNRKISESSVVDTCFSQAPFKHLMWRDDVCWGGTPYVSHWDFIWWLSLWFSHFCALNWFANSNRFPNLQQSQGRLLAFSCLKSLFLFYSYGVAFVWINVGL